MTDVTDNAAEHGFVASTAACDYARGGIWDYISPTRLNLWAQCPLAFRLRYIDVIRFPPTPSLFLGRQVHRGIEHYYRQLLDGEPTSARDAIAWTMAQWEGAVHREGMKFSSAEDERETLEDTKRLLWAYFVKAPANDPMPLAVEQSLQCATVDPDTGEDLGIPLRGIVDLFLADTAGPRIVDIKTTRRGGPLLGISHEVQLSTYAYLTRNCIGFTESSVEIRRLVNTKVPDLQVHRIAPRAHAQMRRLFDLIKAYLDSLASGNYHIRPAWSCSICEYRKSHCDSATEVV